MQNLHLPGTGATRPPHVGTGSIIPRTCDGLRKPPREELLFSDRKGPQEATGSIAKVMINKTEPTELREELLPEMRSIGRYSERNR